MDSKGSAVPRFYVMSPGGKPVFCSDGTLNDEALASMGGVATAAQALASTRGGALEEFAVGPRRVAFAQRGELAFVAVGDMAMPTVVLRRYLEYAHDCVVMVLTAGVHTALRRSPNRDVRDLLGSGAPSILGGLAQRLESHDATGRLSLLAGAPPTLALDQHLRSALGRALASAHSEAARRAPSTLCTLAFCGGRFLAAAQPRLGNDARRLQSTDALLLLNFVESQKAAFIAQEVWAPICLPRFDSRGFFSAYVAYLDAANSLALVFITADDAAETFATFREARSAVEAALVHDDILAATSTAAARPLSASFTPFLPTGCLHAAVVVYEATPGASGSGGLQRQAFAQCAATSPFEPETSWLEYDRLVGRGTGGLEGASAASDAHAAFEVHADGAFATSKRRGCIYVALPGPKVLVCATFRATLGINAVAEYITKLAKTFGLSEGDLFAKPFY